MIKVRVSLSLYTYRREMLELLDEIRAENSSVDIDSDLEFLPEVFPLPGPGLLEPPAIEIVNLPVSVKDGRLDDIIQIYAFSEEVDVVNVYLTLRDEQGNRIEGDYALPNEVVPGHWGYFPTAPEPTGHSIVAQAVAIDELGGIALHTAVLPLEGGKGQ